MIFLTGATGFIGSHLLQTFLRIGKQVRVLVRDPRKLVPIVSPISYPSHHLEVVQGDLLDPSFSVGTALSQVDTIVHCAAMVKVGNEDEKWMTKINVWATERLINAIQNHQYFLLIGSVATFGPTSVLLERADTPLPTQGTPYEITKRKATLLVRQAIQAGKSCGILHPSIVYGKRAHGSITRFAKLIANKKLYTFTGLHSVASFVYIEDVVSAVIQMIERKPVREYILGGTVCTLQEFFQTIADACNGKAPYLNLPKWILLPFAFLNAKLCSLLGVSASFTPTLLRAAHQNWMFGSTIIQQELGIPLHSLQEGVQKWILDI
ncbi:MAG: NAD-dependent epimerase/dehydratase family protein [bacterium]|nr:NAD-dependent epimerase/dehydratase family protein [bacterium]